MIITGKSGVIRKRRRRKNSIYTGPVVLSRLVYLETSFVGVFHYNETIFSQTNTNHVAKMTIHSELLHHYTVLESSAATRHTVGK